MEHLGPPDEVFEVSGSPLPASPVQALNLAYFAPAGPHSPVVFATCGASQYRMKDGRRIEGIVILRREPDGNAFDAVHRMLASFALFAETNDQTIRLGDVVRAPEELEKFCGMDAILFMPPIPFVETFHRAAVTGGEKVEIVWLLPVYESEASYALANGPQALMMLFAAQSLDLTEPHRDEANTLIDPSDAKEMAQRVSEENQKRLAAEGPKPIQQPAKPKSSRRSVGKGSYDVEETQGGAVMVSRRRGKGERPKEEAPRPVEPVAEAEAPPRRASKAPPPKRPAVAPPKKKEEVRFDLGDQRPKKGPPPPAPEKRVEPKEDPAEAKRKRIEELKKKAKEAAERAKARQHGDPPPRSGPTTGGTSGPED